MRPIPPLLAAIAACSAAVGVQAQDWPRYHFGAGIGVGKASFGTDWESVGVPERIRPTQSLEAESGSRWKLSAGFRPLRVVGAEIEYIDFGDGEAEDGYSPHASVSLGGFWMKTKASATVLTAVLFIPDPSPSFDVYGKIGVARYRNSFNVYVSNWTPMCRLLPFGQAPECLFESNGHQTDSQPYVGIGVRFKVVSNFAARLEYEALDGDIGNSTMFSVNIAWER